MLSKLARFIPMLMLGMCLDGIPGHTARAGETATHAVLEHHANAARSGLFVLPALTWEAARQLRRDPNFRAEVAGPVYAQPLYTQLPGRATGVLLVATEQNLVYALDSQRGTLVWRTSVGPPVPRSSLPCGNIDPVGVTGTPVIDSASQAVYLGAMIQDKAARAPRHVVVGLSLRDGSVLPGWPVDVEAVLKANGKTFRSSVQNQRGALTVVGDTVYVPYGGHFGDCGDFRGWVVSISLKPPHTVRSWSTRARGGGVWGPGGVASDEKGIYIVTGNTLGTRQWNDGEAAIRLGLDLSFSVQPREFFVPSNWQQLDAADDDLGGTNPLLLSLPGASPSELLLALGKDGNAYLLNRRNLGGIGGSVATKQVSTDSIRTAPASVGTNDGVFVAFHGRGVGCPAGHGGDLAVMKISTGSPPALSMAWCAAQSGRGSPIITTTDGRANPIVWVVGAEGSNRLRGFRADTGEVLFGGGDPAEAMSQVRRFQTLIAVGRQLYVAADQRVYAFVF